MLTQSDTTKRNECRSEFTLVGEALKRKRSDVVMNQVEAKRILKEELSRYRQRPYAELLSLIDCIETYERVSSSGVTYQIEVQVFFDDESKRCLRVMGAIDDGGWRAFIPLCDDFIIALDEDPGR